MLYDPNWNKQPGKISLESLIGWLETQDPDTEYDWLNPGTCLLGQWLKATGHENYYDISRGITDTRSPFYIKRLAVVALVAERGKETTLGKALKRARKALLVSN